MPNWKKIILSGSSANLNNLYVENAITASALVVSGDITANKLTTNIVSQSILFTSGSNKFGDELSDNHYFTGSVNITGSVTAESFTGDGSGLTNVTTTVVENATVSDTFTNVTSKQVTHNFSTKDVIVSVYNDSDQLIIPSSITTATVNRVDLAFDSSTSGRVVVAKGGHLASGSAVLSGTGVLSGSAQIQLLTRYEQSITGNTSYTITHNLSEDYPIVQIYDSNKLQVLPGLISASSSNEVQLEFDSSFTGKVIVKK